MTRIFTKLNIGDNVASGGGRVFKKLSTESAAEDSIVGTWVFNGHPSTEYMANWFSVEFTSNNENFIAMSDKRSQTSSIHDGNLKYFKTATSYVTVINGGTEEWIEAYKTITILTEPTNAEFIAWLKANATKQNAPSLISFTIEGATYEAESGMTWADWVNSNYNTDGFSIYLDFFCYNTYPISDSTGSHLFSADKVIEGEAYAIEWGGNVDGSGN